MDGSCERHEGLISRCKGIKIGKSSAAIPRAASAKFDELVGKHGISYTVREFYKT